MINIPQTSSGTFGAFRPQEPKKSFLPYLAGLFFLLILASGYYFFFYQGLGFSFGRPNLPPPPSLTPLDKKIIKIQDLQVDLFDGSFYKSLKIYGALPIVADSLGRTNPFIPY